jgi:hypothetical protein
MIHDITDRIQTDTRVRQPLPCHHRLPHNRAVNICRATRPHSTPNPCGVTFGRHYQPIIDGGASIKEQPRYPAHRGAGTTVNTSFPHSIITSFRTGLDNTTNQPDAYILVDPYPAISTPVSLSFEVYRVFRWSTPPTFLQSSSLAPNHLGDISLTQDALIHSRRPTI